MTMGKFRIYKAKEGVDINEFAESGWQLMDPQLGFILYKDIKLGRETDAVKAIKEAYENYADMFCHGKMVEYLRGLDK